MLSECGLVCVNAEPSSDVRIQSAVASRNKEVEAVRVGQEEGCSKEGKQFETVAPV